MIGLDGPPIVLGCIVFAAVLVRVFVFVDRVADHVLAQLHHLRRKGGRTSGFLLSPRGASALDPRSYFIVSTSRRTSALTQKEK